VAGGHVGSRRKKQSVEIAMNHRITFAEWVELERSKATAHAWDKARLASALRHAARASGYRRAARRFAELKVAAVQSVLRLSPDQFKLGLHRVGGHRLVSVRRTK